MFIEGREDRYFFNRLVSHVVDASVLEFEVVTADELPGPAVGKPCLEEYHEYLRRRGSLNDSFKGKRTIALFIGDKDLDDFLRRKRRTGHFLYTEGYDLDNSLFEHGDLAEALAAGAGLASQEVEGALMGRDWCREAAECWREWVYLCFAARSRNWVCGATYRRISQVHEDQCGALRQPAYASYVGALKRAAAMPDADFRRSWQYSRRRVDQLYDVGEHHRVFKGKWYRRFAEWEVARIAAGRGYDQNGVDGRVIVNVG